MNAREHADEIRRIVVAGDLFLDAENPQRLVSRLKEQLVGYESEAKKIATLIESTKKQIEEASKVKPSKVDKQDLLEKPGEK